MKDTPRELMKNRMWKHHLFWIVPLCLIIGYLLGLYINIPKNITIDYGENMVKVVEGLDGLYSKTIQINNTECPDCNCECMIRDGDVVCISLDEYIIKKRNGGLLS